MIICQHRKPGGTAQPHINPPHHLAAQARPRHHFPPASLGCPRHRCPLGTCASKHEPPAPLRPAAPFPPFQPPVVLEGSKRGSRRAVDNATSFKAPSSDMDNAKRGGESEAVSLPSSYLILRVFPLKIFKRSINKVCFETQRGEISSFAERRRAILDIHKRCNHISKRQHTEDWQIKCLKV